VCKYTGPLVICPKLLDTAQTIQHGGRQCSCSNLPWVRVHAIYLDLFALYITLLLTIFKQWPT